MKRRTFVKGAVGTLAAIRLRPLLSRGVPSDNKTVQAAEPVSEEARTAAIQDRIDNRALSETAWLPDVQVHKHWGSAWNPNEKDWYEIEFRGGTIANAAFSEEEFALEDQALSAEFQDLLEERLNALAGQTWKLDGDPCCISRYSSPGHTMIELTLTGWPLRKQR